MIKTIAHSAINRKFALCITKEQRESIKTNKSGKSDSIKWWSLAMLTNLYFPYSSPHLFLSYQILSSFDFRPWLDNSVNQKDLWNPSGVLDWFINLHHAITAWIFLYLIVSPEDELDIRILMRLSYFEEVTTRLIQSSPVSAIYHSKLGVWSSIWPAEQILQIVSMFLVFS